MCAPAKEPRAISVDGPVLGTALGPTLIHEHIFIDLEVWLTAPRTEAARRLVEQPVAPAIYAALRADPFGVRDNLHLDDEDLACDELALFAAAGGRTVVDLTLPDIGRDPARLRRIAARTGLTIVMGCGHYIDGAHPASLAAESVEAIAARLLAELRDGVPVPQGPPEREGIPVSGRRPVHEEVSAPEEAPVRAGVIGEIGTSDPITAMEQRVLEAASEAQRQTGAPLFIHLDPWGRAGHRALDIAEGAGADPRRVVLCHLDPSLPDTAYHRSLAERGATICYDIWGDEAGYGGKGMPTDAQRIAALETAVHESWIDRVGVAQDVCTKTQLRRHGGAGYAHLLTRIVPELRARGHGPELIRLLLEETPGRLLAWA